MTTNIWWIRRDLRLFDNPTLDSAISQGDQLIPLFILDPKLLNSKKTSPKRKAFLLENLRSLDKSLRSKGGKLFVRHGSPLGVFTKLFQDLSANQPVTIFFEEDYSPYARKRDAQIKAHFSTRIIGSPAILPPGSVLKKDGSPYTVFTPYKNSWHSTFHLKGYQPIIEPDVVKVANNINTSDIPSTLSLSLDFSPTENRAIDIFHNFIDGDSPPIIDYNVNRDFFALEGTSKLSPYFRFGVISIKYAVSKTLEILDRHSNPAHKESILSWLNELIWRDFYMQILYYFPDTIQENFRHKNVAWLNGESDFASWCDGITGFPIIDAAMRQLKQTGWMHNRARMIVASFLTKNLLIDWRWGADFFMQQLIDGDLASNVGGWQWAASTGTDAVPYFRIFNPLTQARKFDPKGDYIRLWLPELSNVSGKFIHIPWLMSMEDQVKSGCRIGKEYPYPIVDLNHSRQRALLKFKQTS